MSNSPGNLIVLLDHGFDFRDYLDDKDIHSGDQLDLWHEGRWLAVRYELASFRDRSVVLVGVTQAVALDRMTMRFRWPS
jgi:hypothetical protein